MNRNLAIIGGAVVVVVVAFVLLSGGNDKKHSAKTVTKTVTVKNAKPAGGIQKISANKNDRIKLEVVSDTADEIHVHGYNFMKDVPKNGSIAFDFKATIDGSFEIELEGRKQQIAELDVAP
jgi:hypothetical protein